MLTRLFGEHASAMDSNDPYLDENSVLRNLLGIVDRNQLIEAEGHLVTANALTWPTSSVATFDAEHLKQIHRHLFGDIYSWAGEFRTVDISKGGPELFWPWGTLSERTDRVLAELREGPLLRFGQRDGEFVDAIAMLYLEVNYLHPFREGNGRVQRIFLNEVAGCSARVIDWKAITRADNDAACAHSVATQSPSRLKLLLEPAITTQADRDQRLTLAAGALDKSTS